MYLIVSLINAFTRSIIAFCNKLIIIEVFLSIRILALACNRASFSYLIPNLIIDRFKMSAPQKLTITIKVKDITIANVS